MKVTKLDEKEWILSTNGLSVSFDKAQMDDDDLCIVLTQGETHKATFFLENSKPNALTHFVDAGAVAHG